ncbi:MAG: prephenate dehydratase [Actinomycetota bacterium]|nr:prephenate dehydratase [Actinomycetota bacterium]
MRVAFLGPAGTFTEEALRALAPAGARLAAYPTVHETVMSVHAGEADRAVVPIENSLEGSVVATLDTLAGEADDVRIAGELVHPIRHCLLARRPVELGRIERVLSHPQAMAQCARFLRDRVSAAERVAAASTAEAVKLVAGAEADWAAIGSRLAAELYGCTVLAEGIEDRPDNLTRFVWLAPAAEAQAEAAGRAPPGSGGQALKTSIVFWGFNDRSPGALVAVLRELADRQINMTKIESRPRRVRLGHYMFFADLEGGADEPVVREALAALERRVRTLRVLGSYPAHAGPA